MALELVRNLPYDHPYRWDGSLFGRPRLWRPSNLGSALSLWLDAEDATTITLNGSAVSQWRDKSGNARHFSQPTAAQQPSYSVTGGAGNRPRVFTSSQGRFLTFSGSANVNGLFSIAVYKKDGNGTNTSSTNRLFDLSGSTSALEDEKVGFSQGILMGEVAAQATTDFKIASAIRPQAVKAFGLSAVFGELLHSGVSPFVATGYAPPLSAFLWIGSACEIITASGNLSLENQQRLEGYLAWKWGLEADLSSDHPYKLTPPLV